MQEFKYAALPMPDEREIKVDAESPAYIFQSGKSYFAAYTLPAWSSPYQIRAEAQGANLRGGIFAPSVLMLDGNFNVTRQFNVQDSGPNARPGTVHVFVNDPNKHEQYLVLFSAKLEAGGVNTLMATPTTIAIGAVPVQIGATEARVSVPYSPTGVLQLKVWPYQPQRAGQAKTD